MIGAALISQHNDSLISIGGFLQKNVQKMTLLLTIILPLLKVIGALLRYNF